MSAARRPARRRADAPPTPSETREPRRLRTLGSRVPKASELLAHELLADIAARRLGTGTRLPQEAEMVDTYGVARSTVREALRILEINGLIAIRSGPGGGPVLREATPGDFGRMASFFLQAERITLGDILEARLQLEPFLARGACHRRDRDFLARVADLKERSAEVDVADNDAYLRVTREFHELIGSASNNRVLSLLSQCLMALFAVRVTNHVFPVVDRGSVIREHDRVMAMILDGEAGKAEAAMVQHMARFVKRVRTTRPDLFEQVVGS